MRRQRRPHGDAGAAAVEFAIVAPVVLMVVFMTLWGGLYLFYTAVAEHVARAAARDASIRTAGTWSDYPSTSAVTSAAKRAGGSLLPAPSDVRVASNPDAADPREGDEVTVTVSYDLPAVAAIARAMWFLPVTPSSTVTRSATTRRE